ncbi:MAG TPA: argininosuccinate synthase [Nitrospinaceae bacterium]|jgi:argininosuccinate synthase|nr:argininosuccinate synthase [Nitrospinota bacterium]MBV51741.1 argininosuccinate synthase [Nitrospinota bacterium]MDP6335480.1 argininosuccinate synthase [Nitrospinaceae bacterium]MDP7147963.1 argininosuccinate synthase [Nitrospinaceae bacterium]HJO57937.1 argininosuccinate synthase [Nitrospinaceae bacterium]|tara:strand:- start:783 stop:1985 length:1203 start_codon:yes stop_codon:yes gene_type:complete
MNVKKIVLAYSGGLDTSVIIKWLREKYDAEVVAFAADVGQGQELDPVREKAIATGASEVYVEDLKEEFVRDFVFPMLRGNAFYENDYLLGTAIARPLIAKEQIRIAKNCGADGVSHGATGKGNDQVRFELAYMDLNPDIKIIAPWREWDLTSRTALMDYAKEHGIPVPVSKDKPFSMDRNLFHVSYEGGVLEDPWTEPDEDMFMMTVAPESAPDKATTIEIEYEAGNPVAVNGERMSPATLLAKLNECAGSNGIGRIDVVENRFVGMKSRGVYETPGGTILHIAHRAVESITMDREVMCLRDSLIPSYAKMIYNGFWYSPERALLQNTMDETQKTVTGVVRLKLYKGNCRVVGRKASKSLYDQNVVTFEEGDGYRQDDADGFIRLNALRLKMYSKTYGVK